jgi:hypothetical protein
MGFGTSSCWEAISSARTEIAWLLIPFRNRLREGRAHWLCGRDGGLKEEYVRRTWPKELDFLKGLSGFERPYRRSPVSLDGLMKMGDLSQETGFLWRGGAYGTARYLL